MRHVFLDTSAQLALISEKDEHHNQAVTIFNRLKTSGVRLVMTDYIFDELLTALTGRISRAKAIEYSRLFPPNQVELTFIDIDDFNQAKALFEHYRDKRWSFTDCTSFALMKRRGITEALAFDRHFTQAGFKSVR